MPRRGNTVTTLLAQQLHGFNGRFWMFMAQVPAHRGPRITSPRKCQPTWKGTPASTRRRLRQDQAVGKCACAVARERRRPSGRWDAQSAVMTVMHGKPPFLFQTDGQVAPLKKKLMETLSVSVTELHEEVDE